MTDNKQVLEDIFQKYEGKENELIPILQDIQDVFGFVPALSMKAAAAFLSIPESTVYGVVTFYSQFYLTRQGRHKIQVCQGTACYVKGGKRIMRCVEKKLGIKAGETTEDYEFTVERVACFGSCALAPVVVIDGKVYGSMTVDKTERIIDGLCNKRKLSDNE